MGGGSLRWPQHPLSMHVIWFLLHKHKQATQHDRLKPVSTNMVRPQKHFIYLWEEQKKYTNRSKIRLELEAFIKFGPMESGVGNGGSALSWRSSNFFRWNRILLYLCLNSVILCEQLTLWEVTWLLPKEYLSVFPSTFVREWQWIIDQMFIKKTFLGLSMR